MLASQLQCFKFVADRRGGAGLRTVGEMTVFAPDKERTFRPLAPASKVI
jgi:hypothetical protein